MKTLPQPWSAAMEATMFSGWIYDHLKPHAAALKVAHPLMLRAIAAAKRKNDRIDANKICDCLRCDFLPECYMAPTAIRERRRTLRYRSLLVRQMVQMKIKIGTLLMEAGVSYNKQKLHKADYFRELLTSNPTTVSRYNDLKEAAGVCGRCGLMAMGIQSFRSSVSYWFCGT
jgi:transposase